MSPRRGYRTAQWAWMSPWPFNVLDRILIWPDGCWSLTNIQGGKQRGPEFRSERTVVKNEQTGRQELAYQTIWSIFTGKEPPRRGDGSGKVLFHSCGNVWCVNVGHLELISRSEAQQRIVTRTLGYDASVECPHGHSRAEFGYRTPSGQQKCRACETAARRAYRERHPEKEAAAYERQKARRRAVSALLAELRPKPSAE